MSGELLDRVHAHLTRYVAFPSPEAAATVTLWVAHAHLVDQFDATPRIAFISPEPGSGKSRALEVISSLVPAPMHAVNATPAALFRAVKEFEVRPTILFDEVDTVFGPKAKENEELRGFLNAGHRRGAEAYRCVGERQKVEAFPAFCAVALAGLHGLPDTIASRSIIIRMRRRGPGEKVEPYRFRDEPQGHDLRDQLAYWAEVNSYLANDWEPEMPEGVTDRPADVWEPLLTVAELNSKEWARRARAACLSLTSEEATEPSLGVKLLTDIRAVFEARGNDSRMTTEVLLDALHAMDESPWGDLRGKPLDARRLAFHLRPYGIEPARWREDGSKVRGYARSDLLDPWERYCTPTLPENPGPSGPPGPTPQFQEEIPPSCTTPLSGPLATSSGPSGPLPDPPGPGNLSATYEDLDGLTSGPLGPDGPEKSERVGICPHGIENGDVPDAWLAGLISCPECRREVATSG